MGQYYLQCILEEKIIDTNAFNVMTNEKKAEYKEKAVELYIVCIFLKGAKCHPSIPNMKRDLNRL